MFSAFARAAFELLAPGGDLSILQSPPRLGERVSRILKDECSAPGALTDKLAAAERLFFGSQQDESSRLAWDAGVLEKCFGAAGFVTHERLVDQKEERLLSVRDLSLWFDKDRSPWGSFIARELGDEDFALVRRILEERTRQGPLEWRWKSLLLSARR
jgi:putative ATPase